MDSGLGSNKPLTESTEGNADGSIAGGSMLSVISWREVVAAAGM
jgi:hypothetical protein